MRFLFRLALLLHRTYSELLQTIPSWEIPYWLALYKMGELETPERADLRNAITSAVVANAFRGSKGRGYKAIDFMPRFEKPKPFPPELLFAYFSGLYERQKRKAK